MNGNMQYDSFGSAIKRGFMRMPVAIRTIMLINAVVFVIQALGGDFINGFAVNYLGFDTGYPTVLLQPWRLITYTFIHSGFMHFLFNMLWLWWMGRAVEEHIGPRSFTVVYFGAGILGALLNSVISIAFGTTLVIGASGAVSGIMVAFAMLFPRMPIMLFLFPPIEARFLVAGLIVLDILFLGSDQDNVARWVHLGGALAGYLFIKAYKNGTDLSVVVRYFEYLFGKFKPKRTPNSNMSIVSDAEIIEEVDQDELDRILEKISKKGYDSLTSEEKRKLFELSKED